MSANLCQTNLAGFGGTAALPGYDRAALRPGIVHIGVGNFHRAHQAVFLDDLFAEGIDLDWALVGAGMKPQDARMRDRLKAQDWLSTIVELAPEANRARICGSMIDFVDVDPGALIEALCRPEIRLVTTTITEGGYFVDAKTGGFDAEHEDIRHDVVHPDRPRTIFGVLNAALSRRRAAGTGPFTVLSCDNLPGNGAVARQATAGLASLQSAEFGQWVERTIAFPNSMVDCITPATTDAHRERVRDDFGIIDACPVVCEPFRQWVVEDSFSAGRPSFERVGVEFVDNVEAYEVFEAPGAQRQPCRARLSRRPDGN